MSDSTDLVQANATGSLVVRSMDDLARLGKMLAASGYFTDARDAAQAGVKVLAGLEMGIGAFSAMSGIHIISGKPSVGAGLMAAAVKRSGKYDYRVRVHSAEACEIEFFQGAESIGVSSFTLKDAAQANLTGNATWKKSPKNMLFARALSNGVRWYCPDVFDVSTYTPEELGASVDDEGNIVTVEARPSAPALEATTAPTEAPAPVDVQTSSEEFPPDPPEGMFEGPRGSEASISPAQLKALAVVCKKHDLIDRVLAQRFIGWSIGRAIESSKDLSKAEAHNLLSWTDDDWMERLEAFSVVSAEPPVEAVA